MQLAVPHVNRINAGRSLLQQTVGEAARGGADISADAPCRVDVEGVERVRKLHAAAADVWVARLKVERQVFGDELAGLRGLGAGNGHLAGEHEGARLLTAGRMASADEELVESHAGNAHGHWAKYTD